MTPLAPTSELDAVNALLKAVGETPVNTLDSLGFTDASIARDTLRTKSRELQSRGWYFNRDDAFGFESDIDGNVALPANVLSVRPCDADTRRILPRGNKLWNADDATFIFSADAPPVMEVVWQYAFEELPEAARRYITVVAATQFQTQVMGNETVYSFTKDDEKVALNILVNEERRFEPRANVFNDSVDVNEVWSR